MHWWTCQHWFRKWLGAWLVPRHYLNQWWHIVNYTIRNTFQWNIIWNSKGFIPENAIENVVCEMAAILSLPQCVNGTIVGLLYWHPFILVESLQFNWRLGTLNSLAPGRFQFNFRKVIFKLTLVNGGWGISYEIAIRWMPLDLTDDKSPLVQVMAWCCQATSHYLSQCWPRFMSPNGVTRPQWVNSLKEIYLHPIFKWVVMTWAEDRTPG